MQVVLIRHGRAESRKTFAAAGRPDAERPLTDKGRNRMRKAARGLHAAAPRLQRIVTSPYRRAAETAAIVASAYGLTAEPDDILAPGTAAGEVARWLNGMNADSVALVGHEPDLGRLASWFLDAAAGAAPLKKGAAVRIDFGGPVGEAEGQLVWALTPGLLRRLR